MNDSLETVGIYDSGSNVSIINSKLIKLKKNIYNVNNTNLLTINGVKKTKGMINIKIKIFDIEENMDVYIIDEENFKNEFLIGLDIIKQFKLTQNEDLKISQQTLENQEKTEIVEEISTEKKNKFWVTRKQL